MSWARLDDGFWMHPKILMAGNAAAGVFARMLSYCGCYLTDGLVPAAIVASIEGPDVGAVEALERVGMVTRLDTGSVIITGYLDLNPTKAEVEETQRQRREAGRKGGQKSRPRSKA